jgi:hypothetical protein
MPVYKVPQNVEAEDKLVGPFTFKQFLFLIITAIGVLLMWGLWRISPFIALIPLPLVLIFGFLGVYHREDQPVETYLLAALNFMLKPRIRIWNQEGIRENVRITAPKRKLQPRARNLEAERSQLERLAQILDTRGMAAKEANLQLPSEEAANTNDDRLIMPEPKVSQKAIESDVTAEDDILDPNNSSVGQNYVQLVEEAAKKMREQVLERMQKAATTKPEPVVTQPAQKIVQSVKKTPGSKGLPKDVHFDPYPAMHQRIMDPKTGKISVTGVEENSTDNIALETINTMTPASLDAILELSKNNDLKVSQLAAQAQRRQQQTNQPNNQYGTIPQPNITAG